jgi:hypothetical protein
VFAVKARLSFPFGKSAVANKWNFAGIFAGACLGIFIIYTPPLHVVFGGSYKLSPLYWLIPIAFGFLILAWASLRVIILRKSIEHLRVRDIKGLMMCTLALSWNTLFLPSHIVSPSPNNENYEYTFTWVPEMITKHTNVVKKFICTPLYALRCLAKFSAV